MATIMNGLLVAALTSPSIAQSLINATALDPQLSDFNDLLLAKPDAATGLLTNFSSGGEKQTILVPSNSAFDNYRLQTGSSFSSLSSSDLGNVLNYHTLQGSPAFFPHRPHFTGSATCLGRIYSENILDTSNPCS